MRFFTPQTESQKILSVLHRMRESLMHDRTKTANQMHGFLLEFGISLPKGLASIKRLASVLAEHELLVRLTIVMTVAPAACTCRVFWWKARSTCTRSPAKPTPSA